MPTADELLDLDGVRSRAESARFDLLDRAGNVIGALHPELGVTLENSTTQTVKRRLTSFKLPPSEYDDVNPVSDRVRAVWVLDLGDGEVEEYELGTFLFADPKTTRHSYGRRLAATLVDRMTVLEQPIGASLGWSAGTYAHTALRETFEAAGVFDAVIDTTTYQFGAPLGFPAGQGGTTYAKVLEELAGKAGYHAPYFANDDTPTVRTATNLTTATAAFDYVDGGRIIADAITESNDLLKAPNRFLVIDTSASPGPITYTYPLPADAPHSYENRGFWITKTIEAPGVGSQDQARTVAESFIAQNPLAYETVVFASPPDPRHDTFDVVNFRGTNYLEIAWSLRLAPGGPMTHTATRVYL